jgi:hypothetical protein
VNSADRRNDVPIGTMDEASSVSNPDACRLAKIIPGREERFYEHAKHIEGAVAAQPDCLAVLKLHYLKWLLFPIKGETYFMYQGIFDHGSQHRQGPTSFRHPRNPRETSIYRIGLWDWLVARRT